MGFFAAVFAFLIARRACPEGGTCAGIVAAALQRNYPEMTPDKVENLLDLGNASAVLNAVLTGSGLKPGGAAMGEASAPGTSPGADGASARSVSDMSSETLNPGEKSMVSSRPPVDTATP